MAIIGQQIDSTLGNGGVTTNNTPSLVASKLHKEYSINGNPNIPNKPSPSNLDRNGETPTQYIQNLPG